MDGCRSGLEIMNNQHGHLADLEARQTNAQSSRRHQRRYRGDAAGNRNCKNQRTCPHTNTSRDLTVQETNVEAEILMGTESVLTVCGTSIGTLLIWREVKLTLQAVEYTSDATEAMR